MWYFHNRIVWGSFWSRAHDVPSMRDWYYFWRLMQCKMIIARSNACNSFDRQKNQIFLFPFLKKMFYFHLSFVWKSRFKNSSDILRCKRLWCNCIVAITLTTNWILCRRIRKVPIRKVDRFMHHIDIYSFIHDNWFYLSSGLWQLLISLEYCTYISE